MTNETASYRIYTEMRDRIISGTWPQAEVITESGLTEIYKVSKAPVKTALHRLCREGYLKSYPRKGYFINDVSNDDCIRIQQFRYSLESQVVHHIIRSVPDDRIRSLWEILHPTPGPKEKNPYAAVNTRFHVGLADLLENKLYRNTISQYVGTITRVVIKYPALNDHAKDVHGDIIEALLARDEKKAADLLYEDLSAIFRFER